MRNILHDIRRCTYCVLFFLCGTVVLSAQNDYISNSRIINEDRIDDLNGDCGLLLISKHKDLVINPVAIQKKDVQIKVDGKREDGLYEYRVIIDKDASRLTVNGKTVYTNIG